MADIDIERTRGGVWQWVATVIAVCVAIWLFAALATPDREGDAAGVGATAADGEAAARAAPDAGAPPALGTAGTRPTITEYVEYGRAAPASPDLPAVGIEHGYTAEGIRRLGAALDALVARANTTDSKVDLERFRTTAERLQADPQSREHARLARDAFLAATDVLEPMVGGEVDALRKIAQSIDPARPLLQQEQQVRRFFRESADAIDAAARG